MDLQVNLNGKTIAIEEFQTIATATGATISYHDAKYVRFTGLADWQPVEQQLELLRTRLPAEYSKYRYSDGFMGEEDILLDFNIQYNY